MTSPDSDDRRARQRRHHTADVLEPMNGEHAQVYQRLRSHLAELRLGAAAESLTAVLDAAREQDLSTITVLNGCSASRSPPSRPAGTPGCCGSRRCWRPMRSPTSTSPPNPAWTRS